MNQLLYGFGYCWQTFRYWQEYIFFDENKGYDLSLLCWYFWNNLKHCNNKNDYQKLRF